MKVLRHSTTKYWQFVDKLDNDQIDTIVVDQFGNTISRKILETDIKTYVQTQVEIGYVLDWPGLDEQIKARGMIYRDDTIQMFIAKERAMRYLEIYNRMKVLTNEF